MITMPAPQGVVRRHSKSLGRSGPRSKLGCQTCKLRRVRCDEARPICGHCTRLDLDCVYQPPHSRRRKSTSISRRDHNSPATSSADTVDEEAQHTPSAQGDGTFQESSIVHHSQVERSQPHEVPRSMSHGHTGLSPGFQSQSHQNLMGSTVSGDTAATSMPIDSGVVNLVSLPNADVSMANDQAYAWQDGYLERFTDYHPVPDPPFAFVSLAFENSPDFSHHTQHLDHAATGTASGGDASHSWFGNLPDNPVFSEGPEAASAGISADVSTGGHGVTQDRTRCNSNRESEARTFAPLSVPTLSTTQKEMLLNHFERDIRPPASLAGVDPLGWVKIKPYVLRKARSQSELVTQPLYALTALLSSVDLPFQSSINRYNYKLVAVHMQQSACRFLQQQLLQTDWTAKSQDLLIAVFLLAWFEVSKIKKYINPQPQV